MSLVKTLFSLLLAFTCTLSVAGTFQGGGGGRTNAKVRTYLDTRMYGLDGANKSVAPGIILTNACIEGKSTIHTIEPVWQCLEKEVGEISYCKKRKKNHLQSKFNPIQKICAERKVKLIKGQMKEVCTKFSEDKFKKFKTKFRLDVYRLSAGEGGTSTRPNRDRDYHMTTIDYTIPSCEELDID